MAAYEWKIGGIHKVDADVAGEVCDALARSEEGLSPETLLAASRNEEAPLHGEFEWNDETAAEKYRLGQARKIIVDLTCTTLVAGGDVCERAYVNVRPNPAGAYVSIQSALTNEEWKAHLYRAAVRDMQSFKAKYGRLEQLSSVIAAIDVAVGG